MSDFLLQSRDSRCCTHTSKDWKRCRSALRPSKAVAWYFGDGGDLDHEVGMVQPLNLLPHEGLLPSELFVEAFDRNAELIKQLCRLKYQCRDFEKEGELDIVIHRKDIFALRT